MPYPQKIVEWLLAEAEICYCCKLVFTKLDYKAAHSSTGEHWVLEEAEDGRYVYRVTDPPAEYGFMKGKVREIDNEFQKGLNYKGDAVVVCHNCHKKVHALALSLSREKNPDFIGNTPTPRSLYTVTHIYDYYVHKHRWKPEKNRK